MTATHSSSDPLPAPRAPRGSARDKLIAAAHQEVRRQGYAATTVDQICAAAGVTKGAFFHHFESKEALAVAAAEAWARRQGISEIASDIEAGDAAARRWHRRMGFEETETVVCLRRRIG